MGGAPSMPIDDQPRLQVIAAGYSRTGTTSISLAIEHLLGGPVFHGGNHIFQRNDGNNSQPCLDFLSPRCSSSKTFLAKDTFPRHGLPPSQSSSNQSSSNIFEKKKSKRISLTRTGWLRDWCRTLSARPDRALFLSHLRRMTVGFVGVADTPAYCVMPELLALYPDAKVVLVTRDRERWYRSMAPIMKNIAAAPLWVLDVVLWPCPTWCWLPEYFRLVSRRYVSTPLPLHPLSPK